MANGNCLFSSASLSLVEDNSLVHWNDDGSCWLSLQVNATYAQYPAKKPISSNGWQVIFLLFEIPKQVTQIPCMRLLSKDRQYVKIEGICINFMF